MTAATAVSPLSLDAADLRSIVGAKSHAAYNLIQEAARGDRSLLILIAGDSTATDAGGDASDINFVNGWSYQLFAQLAPLFPKMTFQMRSGMSASRSSISFGRTRTIQTGTGARTCQIVNCALSGSVPGTLWGSTNMPWAYLAAVGVSGQQRADLIMWDFGYNMTSASGYRAVAAEHYASLSRLMGYHPDAGVCVVEQWQPYNQLDPSNNAGYWNSRAARALSYMAGATLIETNNKMLAAGGPASYFISTTTGEVHMSAAGYKAIIVDPLINDVMSAQSMAWPKRPTALNPVPNLLSNGDFSAITGGGAPGWTVTNCTIAPNTSKYQTGGQSADLTITGNATAIIEQSITDVSVLRRISGKPITLSSLYGIDTGSPTNNMAVLGISYNGTSVTGQPAMSGVSGLHDIHNGEYVAKALTYVMPVITNFAIPLKIQFYPANSPSGNTAAGLVVNIDHLMLNVGDQPLSLPNYTSDLAATQAEIGLMGIPFRPSRSPYVYGNAGILDRLLADRELWHGLCFGDSRWNGIIASKFVGEAPAPVPLGGIVPPSNNNGAGAAVLCGSITSAGGGDALPTSPYIGSVIDVMSTLEFKTVAGQTTQAQTNTLSNRLSVTSLSLANMTTLKARLAARSVRVRGLIRKSDLSWSASTTPLLSGTTMPSIYVQHRANGSTGSGDSTFFKSGVLGLYTTSKAQQYVVGGATIPAGMDWATNNQPDLSYVCDASITIGQDAKYVAAAPPWLELPTGILLREVRCNPGASIDTMLNEEVVPVETYRAAVAMGGRHSLWLAFGTNTGTIGANAAKFKSAVMSAIEKFRGVVGFGAPVVMTTNYAASGDGGVEPYYVQALRDIASLDPNVVVLDTYASLPGYTAGNGLSYYADTIHYNATGQSAYVAKTWELFTTA